MMITTVLAGLMTNSAAAYQVVGVGCLAHLHEHVSALRAATLVRVCRVEAARPVCRDGSSHLWILHTHCKHV